jgi:hypothetical protein
VVLLVLIISGIAGTIYLQRQGKTKGAAPQAQSQSPGSAAGSAPSSASDNSSSGAPADEAASSAQTPASSEPGQQTPGPVAAAPAPQPVSTPPVAESVRAMNLGNYPGATPVAIATLSGETVVAGFLTRDTPQQVMQYYKIRFPVSTMTDSGGKGTLSAMLPGGVRIKIHAEPQGGNTQVMVLQEN